MNLKPNFQRPSKIMGIFRMRLIVPVGIGINLLIRIATPVIPPGAILFGSRKRLIATA